MTVPGQVTFPALADELGYEAITHLSPRQERFSWELVLNSGNASEAYRRAYPDSAAKSATANASRLLRSEPIQKRIAEIRAELSRRYTVSADDIVRALAQAALIDRRAFLDGEGKPLPAGELPPEAAAIIDIEITEGGKKATYRVPRRLDALTELAKVFGLHRQGADIPGIGVASNVNIYIPDNSRDDIEKLEQLKVSFNARLAGTESGT